MKLWLTLVILIGVPIFVISARDLVHAGYSNDGSGYVGLFVPVAMILFGIFLPKFGLLLGSPEEKFILGFLERTLIAQKCESSANT